MNSLCRLFSTGRNAAEQFLKRPRPALVTLPAGHVLLEFYNTEMNIYTLGRVTDDINLLTHHTNLIKEEFVKFQVWSDHIYLERLYVDDLRTTLGEQVPLRGKDIIRAIQNVCDQIHIGCHVVDDSNIQLRCLMKTGKTYYEKHGFESHIPEELRYFCIQKGDLCKRVLQTRDRFLDEERYDVVLSAMDSLLKLLKSHEDHDLITLSMIGAAIQKYMEGWEHEFAKSLIYVDLLQFDETFVSNADFKSAIYKPKSAKKF